MALDLADPSASLFGILAPLVTPFNVDGTIDVDALTIQIEWLVNAGVAGLVVGHPMSQTATLDDDSWIAVARSTHDSLAGRRTFVVALATDNMPDAIRRACALRELNVDAMLAPPFETAGAADREAAARPFRDLFGHAGHPIIIDNGSMNCDVPDTAVSAKQLHAVMGSVAEVVGVCHRSTDFKAFADMMLDLPDDKVILGGFDPFLYSGLSLGAHGAVTALGAALPQVGVALHRAVRRGDHETARGVHECLLRLWNSLPVGRLAACIGYMQSCQGLPASGSDNASGALSDRLKSGIDRELDPMLAMLGHVRTAA